MDVAAPGDGTPALTPFTAKELLDLLGEIETRLLNRRFSTVVIEATLDRLVYAALPRLLGTAPPPRDWRVWLFGCAYRAARQVASREPKCQCVDPSTLEMQSDERSRETDHGPLYAALEILSDLQRRAVELCVMLGKTLEEAAREMGRDRRTVKHHRDRGLALLSRHLSM